MRITEHPYSKQYIIIRFIIKNNQPPYTLSYVQDKLKYKKIREISVHDKSPTHLVYFIYDQSSKVNFIPWY